MLICVRCSFPQPIINRRPHQCAEEDHVDDGEDAIDGICGNQRRWQHEQNADPYPQTPHQAHIVGGPEFDHAPDLGQVKEGEDDAHDHADTNPDF